MSLVFMTVSAAAELPCCKDGHLEVHLAASSAKDCQLGFEVGSESFLTYSKLSCVPNKAAFHHVPTAIWLATGPSSKKAFLR